MDHYSVRETVDGRWIVLRNGVQIGLPFATQAEAESYRLEKEAGRI